MIRLSIISPKYGDKVMMCSPEQVFQLKNDGGHRFALVQDGRVVTKQSELQDGMDATLVPQIAGG